MKSAFNLTKIQRALSRSIVVFAVGLILPSAALQAQNIWVGGASNGNFSDIANWDFAPSWSFTNSLIFQTNTSAPTLNFNIDISLTNVIVNDIFFDTTFPVARTLQTEPGGVIYFKTRLENLSAHKQTINMPLLGGYDGADSIQLNPVGGSLVIDGDFYNDFNKSYAVFGSQTTNVTSLTLNTGIGLRGTNQESINFTVAGDRNVAVQVNTNQIWQGLTDIQAGTFTTASGVQLASSDIFINGGNVTTTSADTFSDSAKLRVNVGQLSVGGSDIVGSLEGTGGSVDISSSATLTIGTDNTSTSYAGTISGLGGVSKVGTGVMTLSGTNNYSGTTTVSGGTLNLNKTAGGDAIAGAVVVDSGAILLLSSSDNVENTAAVTLSGGTITRGTGVSETFGALTLNGNSFLNFGGVSEAANLAFGALSLGVYNVSVSGFALNNQLKYAAASEDDGLSLLSRFSFDNSYTTSFNTGTFTITAIPEPSTYVAAIGLLALLVWPLCRRQRVKVS